MTNVSPVLVTGATGRHGSTGAHVVRRLREEGRAVRVLARTPGERTEALAGLGAEIVRGDLRDRRSLVPALDGVELAYFTYPIDAGVVGAAANYAAAVREAGGRPRTVVMSMGPAHPRHPSDRGRDQWLAEEVLQWAGLDLLVLRVAAAFHENIPVLHGRSVGREGVIRNCFGDAEVAWINGADAGELAVAALLHPERFDGPVCHPAGSEQFSHAGIAALLAEDLGRPVRFEAISREQWRQELTELSTVDTSGVVNPDMAAHISAVASAVADRGPTRAADAAALTALIGRPPVPLRDYLRTSRKAFA
ncbi:NmrA family NAD(P)-binding protein [Amycolatopsis sp. OK19-0408]|uniref:NmrA family NAD(P)-binding protein n=1 Tax=Amycolatopsis iheyensis TaxID=2945988 RepID=A0A9X2NA62_9PSEU|nr:NmrA family NAD(P)-binding protein [Amycolatopsis iheyensis]MCR6484996.1 NmrA family NAD(P)-binding protein [Amycolatopsis iheyensis]